MFRSVFSFATARWFGFEYLAVAALVCLGMAGCANLDLGGERFQADPAFELGSQLRKPDDRTKPVAVTNKSIQIEHNLGVR